MRGNQLEIFMVHAQLLCAVNTCSKDKPNMTFHWLYMGFRNVLPFDHSFISFEALNASMFSNISLLFAQEMYDQTSLSLYHFELEVQV